MRWQQAIGATWLGAMCLASACTQRADPPLELETIRTASPECGRINELREKEPGVVIAVTDPPNEGTAGCVIELNTTSSDPLRVEHAPAGFSLLRELPGDDGSSIVFGATERSTGSKLEYGLFEHGPRGLERTATLEQPLRTMLSRVPGFIRVGDRFVAVVADKDTTCGNSEYVLHAWDGSDTDAFELPGDIRYHDPRVHVLTSLNRDLVAAGARSFPDHATRSDSKMATRLEAGDVLYVTRAGAEGSRWQVELPVPENAPDRVMVVELVASDHAVFVLGKAEGVVDEAKAETKTVLWLTKLAAEDGAISWQRSLPAARHGDLRLQQDGVAVALVGAYDDEPYSIVMRYDFTGDGASELGVRKVTWGADRVAAGEGKRVWLGGFTEASGAWLAGIDVVSEEPPR